MSKDKASCTMHGTWPLIADYHMYSSALHAIPKGGLTATHLCICFGQNFIHVGLTMPAICYYISHATTCTRHDDTMECQKAAAETTAEEVGAISRVLEGTFASIL